MTETSSDSVMLTASPSLSLTLLFWRGTGGLDAVASVLLTRGVALLAPPIPCCRRVFLMSNTAVGVMQMVSGLLRQVNNDVLTAGSRFERVRIASSTSATRSDTAAAAALRHTPLAHQQQLTISLKGLL